MKKTIDPIFLCLVHLFLIAFVVYDSLSHDALAQDIESALRGDVNVSAAENHLNRGLALLSRGNGDDLYYAKQNFQFVVDMKDDHGLRPVAYLNLGVINFMEGNYNLAVKNYQAAIQLNPGYAEAYFNMGAVYYKQNLLQKAEEVFLKALEIEPQYGRAHYSLGFLYLDQKKYDLAKIHAEKAAENGVPFRTLKERLAKVGR